MKITLQLFGQLRHLADSEEAVIDLATSATVADALLDASEKFGDEFRMILFDDAGYIRPSVMVLLNDTAVDKTDPPAVSDGDIISVLPAIAGG